MYTMLSNTNQRQQTKDNYCPPFERGRVPKFPFVGVARTSVKDIQLAVNRHQLGNRAVSDCGAKPPPFLKTVRSIVGKHLSWEVPDSELPRWKDVDPGKAHQMITELEEKYHWMRKFENHWCARCLLGKHINSKSSDELRSRRKPARSTLSLPLPVEEGDMAEGIDSCEESVVMSGVDECSGAGESGSDSAGVYATRYLLTCC